MLYAGNVKQMGEEGKKNAYRLLLGKPEGKRPLAKQRPRSAVPNLFYFPYLLIRLLIYEYPLSSLLPCPSLRNVFF
jgi:hypothetical protein